jgi:FMN phosphatase YigB (HAD superfamily)
MAEPRKPSMIVFDLDDTLYPYEPAHRAGTEAAVAYGVAETRVTRPEFEKAWSAARGRVKARLGATGASHSRLLYAHEATELLGFRSQPALSLALEQEYWRNYMLAMELRPGAEEFLALLRYNDIPISIVTDLTVQIQLRKLVHLKLDALVDHVVISSETSGDKVTLEPFRLLAERVDRALFEHVWFIGDGPHDAPIEKLTAEGILTDGFGWIRGGKVPGTRDWSDFSEIGATLERLVGLRD